MKRFGEKTIGRELSRRQMLRSLVCGSPFLLPGVLSQCLAAEARAAEVAGTSPKPPHFPARAKRVIFLYMSGGVPHMDSFDPKPRLIADHGKIFPAESYGIKLPNPTTFLRPRWDFQPGGKCGTMVSDLFPHIRTCMDDICLIRSMTTDHSDHTQATLGMHTGSFSVARPSMGSWISYGLGTLNQNLPSYVVLAPELPYAGDQVWAADFLPGVHQGTRITPGAEPVRNLVRRAPSAQVQELELGLLERLNLKHQEERPPNPALAARIKSFETAFGMQKEMPDVLDLSHETDATLGLYGLERGQASGFAWQCLVARRMAERGVRFIELIDTGSNVQSNWDAHGNLASLEPLAKNVDQAIAGLLKDLKSRGMLDETLVVWTTEFGRTPYNDSPGGRNHHGRAYSSWLAGGGIKGGITYGNTDDHGFAVAEKKVHVHDFHATILHLLGLDHEKLTYRHAGRDFRLTDVAGRVVKDVLL